VSDSFEKLDNKFNYEIAFRRWLVRELEKERISISEAINRFNFHPISGRKLISDWRKRYAPSMFVPLPSMTEKEKQELAALKKQIKAMEKQLEDAKCAK
jgi:transposase